MLHRIALALTCTATLAATGCLVVDPNPTGPGPGTVQPPVGSGDIRPGSGIPTSFVLAGAGAIDPGYSGYIITANTGVFRVTWAGDREFRGSIFGNPNDFGQLFAGCQDGSCSLNTAEDTLQLDANDPERIDFLSYPVSGKRSGFDIQVQSGVLALDLFVDDVRAPQRVEFTSGDAQALGMTVTAPGMPFALSTMGTGMAVDPPKTTEKTVAAPAPFTGDQVKEASTFSPPGSTLKVFLPKGGEALRAVFSTK